MTKYVERRNVERRNGERRELVKDKCVVDLEACERAARLHADLVTASCYPTNNPFNCGFNFELQRRAFWNREHKKEWTRLTQK